MVYTDIIAREAESLPPEKQEDTGFHSLPQNEVSTRRACFIAKNCRGN